MKEQVAICAKGLGKCYHLYNRPLDRLKQSLWRSRKIFYREFWALRDVSLQINRGEIVGVVGSNGSGKSTLLQLICGILTPTVGQVHVNGRVAALLELGAGFNPEYTGRDNIYMNGSVLGLTREEIDELYEKIVDFADIGAFIDQPVKTYSSGMYVRLAFAVAVHVSPDILVIDEALAVGDIRFQQKCMARLKEFCREGTVLFVSHNTAAIVELCTRALWIENGKLMMDGTPKRVTERYIQHMYEKDSRRARVIARQGNGSVNHLEGFLAVKGKGNQFGDMRAEIQAIRFGGENGDGGLCVEAGQPIRIGILVETSTIISNPIVGFMVKDRWGRIIFGDNTALMGKIFDPLLPDGQYLVEFDIPAWPNLKEDDYSLSVAIADGELREHTPCHWIDGVLVFKSLAIRTPAGIFSIPETQVSLTKTKPL